uniref:Choline transporter-like protein n=1 Tax=Chrysotila carterae TaxID=13221 RepID=A0A7S4BTQ6_CHRCT
MCARHACVRARACACVCSCSCRCAMWCLQKTIEFVSTYSYVFVAINGTTFCRGCRDTFKLIVSYPAQTAINQTIKKFLTLLISWSTPVICAVLCFFILDNDQSYKENYAPLYPALTVFLGGFLLSVGITTVLEASIDTIYLCAFKDMEANKNGPTFMSNDLRKAFGLDVAKEEAGKKAELFVPAEARKQQNGIPGNRASANNFVSP